MTCIAMNHIWKRTIVPTMKSVFPARVIRLIKNAGISCMVFIVILQIRDSAKNPNSQEHTEVENRKFSGLYVPYIVSPLDGEELKDGRVLQEQKQGSYRETGVSVAQPTTNVEYHERPFKELAFTSKGTSDKWKKYGTQLEVVGDYFRYLRESQTDCRKLKRMGGRVQCEEGRGDIDKMDGHKYVCLDAPLRLLSGTNDSSRCLTLSYGTQTDTTFDEDISELPCEVHMFDVLDFKPLLPSMADHVHFHVEGLANFKRVNHFSNLNLTVPMDTLQNQVAKFNLSKRLIHVLKVDIEGEEWETFTDIAQDPVFDAVGQVALEVHALELVKGLKEKVFSALPEDQWLNAVQKRYKVFRAIEARGFRRVLYWENAHKSYPFYDTDGTLYATSGEMLYINTNWYNPAFMNELAARGYDFQDIT